MPVSQATSSNGAPHAIAAVILTFRRTAWGIPLSGKYPARQRRQLTIRVICVTETCFPRRNRRKSVRESPVQSSINIQGSACGTIRIRRPPPVPLPGTQKKSPSMWLQGSRRQAWASFGLRASHTCKWTNREISRPPLCTSPSSRSRITPADGSTRGAGGDKGRASW